MGGLALAFAAAGFWSGILLAALEERFLGLPLLVALLLGGTTGLGGIAAGRRRLPMLFRLGAATALFVFLGVGWGGLRALHVTRSPLAPLEGRGVRVWGSLQTEPRRERIGWSASMEARTLVLLSTPQGPALSVRDPVWLEGDDHQPRARPGDSVVVEGTIHAPSDAFGNHLRRLGYPALLDVDLLEVQGPAASPLLRAAWTVRSALSRSLRAIFPSREAGLLMGLSLGDTSRLDPDIEENFRATGLSHLTAVSGENLVMFLGPVLAVTVLLRFGSRGTLGVGLVATGFFVLLTGAEPSVLRAAAMSFLTMMGVFLGRPRNPPAIMGGAVLLLLLFNPTLVHSVGFQLSVAATAGMALMATPLANRLEFLPRWLALPAGTTIAAQAGVTPLLLYHVGLVPTVTVLANVLAFPSVPPAMLLGLLGGLTGLAWKPLGFMIALPARIPLRYLEGVADRLARSPFPIITSPGNQVLVLALGLMAVLGAAWWIRSGARLPRTALPVMTVIAALFAWSSGLQAGPPTLLTVTFFDVGQGDAALVRSPGGSSILIDGGPDEQQVARKIGALGLRRLDVVVATHPHADHVAGLPAVLARFGVALVVDPGCAGDSPFYADFLRAVRAAGVPFRHPAPGTVLVVGDVRLEMLGPDRCYKGTDSDPNNDSLVLRLVSGTSSILFSGDVEEPAQQAIIDHRPGGLTADVLKVPHHGGDTSLEGFVGAVDARLAVVSVGPNRYGHPVRSVLIALARLGMRVFRTDRSGDVTVRFRRDDLLIQSSHG